MSDKKSFILYLDQKELFDSLPDEIAGKLIKHIFSYVNCEEPTSDDLIINVAFASIKQSLKRDRLTSGNEVPTNSTVSVSVSDSVSVNVSDSVSVSEKNIRALPAKLDYSILQMTEKQCSDVTRIRKKNKGTALTQVIIDQLAKQFFLAEQNGFTFNDSLVEWEVRGWKSFKADWMKSNNQKTQNQLVSTTEFFK